MSEGEPAWQRFLATVSIRSAHSLPTPCRHAPFTYAPKLSYRSSSAAGRGMGHAAVGSGLCRPALQHRYSLDASRVLNGLGGYFRKSLQHRHIARNESGRIQPHHARRGRRNRKLYCARVTPPSRVLPTLPPFRCSTSRRLPTAKWRGGWANLIWFGVLWPRIMPSSGQTYVAYSKRNPAWRTKHLDVTDAIDCLNVAGLNNPQKQNWYAVDLNDVVQNAAIISGFTPERNARYSANGSVGAARVRT